VSHSDAHDLKAITDAYRGSTNPKDIAKLGAQIAKELSDNDGDSTEHRAVLAIPFGAPAGDPAAEKLADATFAQTYGRLSVTHRGQVGLDKNALPTNDAADALARARANHSTYVVYGAVRALAQGAPPILTVTVARVEDGTAIWTESYPGVGADAAKIAEQVSSQVPAAASDDE
jgi:TolB-like protein